MDGEEEYLAEEMEKRRCRAGRQEQDGNETWGSRKKMTMKEKKSGPITKLRDLAGGGKCAKKDETVFEKVKIDLEVIYVWAWHVGCSDGGIIGDLGSWITNATMADCEAHGKSESHTTPTGNECNRYPISPVEGENFGLCPSI
jgi:hypothetical protein